MTDRTKVDDILAYLDAHPGSLVAEIASGMGVVATAISGAVTRLCQAGAIFRTGERQRYRYSLSGEFDDIDPEMAMVTVKSSAGNPVFNDCRQSSGNYWLTKLVREVRA